MFSPGLINAIPMSLAPHFSLCNAPTMLEVRGQSHYSPSRTDLAAMPLYHFPLGRRRLDHGRLGDQRNEVRTEIFPPSI